MLDGYVDTTERQNLVLSGNLVGDLKPATLSTLLFGAGGSAPQQMIATI